jgi:polar amino acid transport system substrate-binding protein
MKKVKVVGALVLTLTLLTAVAATAGPVLDRILKRGELVVGTSGDQPPLTVKAKDGKVIGLDADLSMIIAEAMGVKLRLKTMPFPELLPALEAGRIDMVLSGLTITPKRNLKAAYVGPYYISGKGILTKSATLATLQDASEMNEAGMTLVAVRRSTSQVFAEKVLPKANLIATDTLSDGLALLIEDKADALIAEYPYCAFTAFRYKSKGLSAGATRFTFEPLGIALPEGDPLLVNWVENVLRTLKKSGDLQELIDRWFKDAGWLKELP